MKFINCTDYPHTVTLVHAGPFYKYEMPMEGISRAKMLTPNPQFSPDVAGSPRLVRGKVGQALQPNGRNQYLDAGEWSACG